MAGLAISLLPSGPYGSVSLPELVAAAQSAGGVYYRVDDITELRGELAGLGVAVEERSALGGRWAVDRNGAVSVEPRVRAIVGRPPETVPVADRSGWTAPDEDFYYGWLQVSGEVV